MSRHALVAGATGLVGSHLLGRLLADARYTRVSVLARRPLQHVAPAKLDVIVHDFVDIEALGARLHADDVFCCLGTTLAKAGSRPAFAHVDHELVMQFAQAARHAGSRQFLVISAAGASLGSPSFYSRTKAKVERDLRRLDYRSLHLVRPSLLLGERSDARPLEAFAQRAAAFAGPLLSKRLGRYQPVSAETLAAFLQAEALRDRVGVHVHEAPFVL